ncbi:CPBP family intramembrane metalloprotease [Agromyces atrinae]|uniref:CPBP family intramembrane glutamic endopeptidase n=1 Tax=Agromyces atrinae TaxID=592376 RepID=UPI001F59C0E2|nr:type II CAAX endopeptidase family protein [Agromyces atrinae]MCI2956308.1 CPBP family intramembrane metalloprotease [Agromyces atrinae]
MSVVDKRDRARFGTLLERRDDRDFPFYDGQPVEVAAWKWIVIILGCFAAFAVFVSIPADNNVSSLLPRALFPAIMLAVFVLLTGRHWSAIFKKLTGSDWLNMVVFGLLTIVISFVVGAILRAIFGASANTAADGLAAGGPVEIGAFLVGTAMQLFGEELFTILPFLAIMYLLHAHAGLGRKSAMVIAWLITALYFGAAHLPTYDWNVAQALIGIGVARLVLTLAYMRTKNIAVSTGAHIINDWIGFGVVVATSTALIR